MSEYNFLKFNERPNWKNNEALENIFESTVEGNFSGKEKLLDLIKKINETTEPRKILAVKLYCHIANHDDIKNLGDIIGELDHELTWAFAANAGFTLSLQAIPYLLAVIEDHGDSDISRNALRSINTLIQFGYDESPVDLNKLSEVIRLFIEKSDVSAFYFYGNLAFAGDLTKILYAKTIEAMHSGREFSLSLIPNTLSAWSGLECPVKYKQILSHEKIKEVSNYVKNISEMKFERGHKYFYGREIS